MVFCLKINVLQISGELTSARNALVEVLTRLKAGVFREDRDFPKISEYDGSQVLPFVTQQLEALGGANV